jgi:very-short-patch-repair endonuclease
VETLFEKQRALSLAIDLWRKSLVSFDGNNRQIYYRNKKIGDVNFEDQYVDANALEKLLQGGKVRVSALYPKLVTKISSQSVQDVVGLDQADDDSNLDDSEETDLAKIWAFRLRRFEAVYRKTKEDSEERNIETCFIAEGFVSWQPKQSGTTQPNAPLLLHPIKIESVSRGNSDFSLEKTGEAVLNEALCLFLETEFGIARDLFEIDSEELRLESDQVQTLMLKLKEAVPGFHVKQERLLGNFAFAHYPMVMDLQRIMSQGTVHPVLSALAGLEHSKETLARLGTEEDLEILSIKDPIHENLVFPADSSQHAAISAILGGKNVVIQGPPGTGKSQTIANVIAEAAANRKSVLFVAEKRAAIDAVVERLADKGLKGIILDLHGEPDKKTIAKNLTEVLRTFDIPREMPNVDIDGLLKAKKLLQSRWDWFRQDTDLVDRQGNKLQIADLIRRVGHKGSQIDRSLISEGLNFISQLDRITPEVRDSLTERIDVLFRCGYFSEPILNSVVEEFAEKVKTKEIAEDLILQFSTLRNIVNTREFKQSFSIATNLIPTTLNSVRSIENTLSKHSEVTKAISEWNIEKYDEVIELIPVFGSLSNYRKSRNLSIFSAYFARKREMTSALNYRKGSQLPKSKREFSKSLIFFEKSVKEWLAIGGDLKALQNGQPGIERFQEVIKQVNPLLAGMEWLKISVPLRDCTLEVLEEKVDLVILELAYIRDLPQIHEALDMVRDFGLTGVVELFGDKEISQVEASLYWDYLWHSAHLKNILLTSTSSGLSATFLNDAIGEFRSKDLKHFESIPGRIIRSTSVGLINSASPGNQLLRKESFKKSGHLPFRELISKIPDEIKAIKPCFAMSPLAVSKLLPSIEGMFDIVIFDEASQIRPENAITAIYRGKQIVVAGDRHQLPPTSVGVAAATANVLINSDEELMNPNLQTEDMESILDAVASIFPAGDSHIKPLKLHYRSNDERLISWSNFHIYREAGEEMASFPSVSTEAAEVLRYTYLPGVKTQSMSQANEPEIREVIKIVKQHIRERPDQSLGVIAFGSRHAVRLQDAFNVLEKEDLAFYEWKSEWNGRREKFFVKNIERVQGDERDAIIISPGYAPNLQGTVQLQFGSLNINGGERRLNVAASRAKNSLHLVTSIKSTEIDLHRSNSRSIALFKSFLNFMENTGRLEELPEGFAVTESPFEEEVYEALTKAGLQVDCQVGDSRYKIDFGVRHPKTNKYVLAIEADGWTYHNSPYARERDWLRQEVLERKGWTFVRIWSTDWWENPNFEVNRVLHAYKLALKDTDLIPRQEETVTTPSRNENTESDGNNEYEVLRGLVAQFPNMAREELLNNWMRVLNLRRRTANMVERFDGYLRRIRKELKK